MRRVDGLPAAAGDVLEQRLIVAAVPSLIRSACPRCGDASRSPGAVALFVSSVVIAFGEDIEVRRRRGERRIERDADDVLQPANLRRRAAAFEARPGRTSAPAPAPPASRAAEMTSGLLSAISSLTDDLQRREFPRRRRDIGIARVGRRDRRRFRVQAAAGSLSMRGMWSTSRIVRDARECRSAASRSRPPGGR